MPTFWPRLLLHGLTWLVMVLNLTGARLALTLLLGAAYLAGFFVSQLEVASLLRSAGRVSAFVAGLAGLMVVAPSSSAHVLGLLAFLVLAPPLIDEAVISRALWSVPIALLAAAAGFIATVMLVFGLDGSVPALLLLGLATYLVGSGTAAFRRVASESSEGTERYGALLSEHRDLKRVSAASADAARAEERISVARRLHDSVGQRLTSLLMQLEVSRLRAETEDERQRAVDLKRLAQASLDETRAAVTALNEDELAGMPALLRLIHNLEVESAMQIEFTVGSGAMSVQLEHGPAVALYRAMHEALTNAMRHGTSRRAKVTVEVPGGRLLRFEVVNDVASGRGPSAAGRQAHEGDAAVRGGVTEPMFRPGFGLTTMRERVEAAGGQLEVIGGKGQFLVRGSFPLEP